MTIRATTVEALEAHHRRYYVPNNAALVIAGDVQIDKAFEWAEDKFRKWDAAPDPVAELDAELIPRLARDTVFVVPGTAEEVTFSVSWTGPSSVGDPESVAIADLLVGIGNSGWSRLQHDLVGSGSFVAVELGHQAHRSGGPLTLLARTTVDRLPEAASTLRMTLDRLASDNYFSALDVETARAAMRFQRALREERTAAMANWTGALWGTGLYAELDRWEASLASATPTELQDFARRFIDGSPRAVGLLVSEETIASHGEALMQSLDGWIRP